MKVREARESEAGEITRELWLPLIEEMEQVSSYNELAEDIDIESGVEHKRKQITEDDRYMFVVEDSGLKGFASATLETPPPIFSRDSKLTINELFVLKEARRQGLAEKLLERMEEKAEKLGCDTLELSIDVENEKAKELYRKHGLESRRERMVKQL